MTVRPDRIPCEVLGCRRTAARTKYPVGTRIICGKCWRLGEPADRQAFREAGRRMRELAYIEQLPDDQRETRLVRELVAARRDVDAAWDRVKTQASEARAGIS